MSRPIRILHVVHAFSAGGLENGIVNIVNNSPKHIRHELCFLATRGPFLSRLHHQVPYFELDKRPGNDFSMIWKLQRILKSRRIDIIHTRNWAAFDGILAACLTPRAILIHGEHGRDIKDPRGHNRRRNFLRRAFAFRARKFVTVSEDLCQWLRQIVKIPEGKLVLIPNGVDTQRYLPRRDFDLRRELGIGPAEFVVGTIGRLDPIKNHEGLINAVRMMNRKNAGVRLVIVGDGPQRSSLDRLLASAPCQPMPILTGHRPDPERFYGLFDLFVLSSHAEGMSNTLLEAMASGLPIVCTAVGGNTQLIANEINGKHVSPGQDEELAKRISEYQADPGLMRLHGTASRRRIEEDFSLEKMIGRYVELYENSV